jgi:ribonuclease HI
MGLGIVLLAPDGTRTEHSSIAGRYRLQQRSRTACALRAALDLAFTAGARALLLRGDSDVALRYVRGPDSTGIARLQVLIESARERLRRFDDVQLLWVPRHRNREADRLSRQALGLPESLPSKGRGRRRR